MLRCLKAKLLQSMADKQNQAVRKRYTTLRQELMDSLKVASQVWSYKISESDPQAPAERVGVSEFIE